MKLKQWPIWKINISYIWDIEVKKIIWTDRNWKLKELDIPTRQTL